MHTAYAFEAKSIQSFLTEGGRLRHMVGASALVDGLARESDPPDDLIARLAQAEPAFRDITFSRRAGGAFIALHPDAAILAGFRAAFTAALALVAPGLVYNDALATGEDDHASLVALRPKLDAAAAAPPLDLPTAQPAFALAPRTGRPAIGAVGKDDLADAATAAKEAALIADRRAPGGIGTRLLPTEVAGLRWPLDMEPGGPDSFPLLRGNQTVAVMHADGNRFGSAISAFVADLRAARAPDAITALRELSRMIGTATLAAARTAVAQDLLGHAREGMLPARPIVLGGDDLTIILRGDVALPFTQRFLDRFAAETAERLARLREGEALPGGNPLSEPSRAALARHFPEGLTAGAGLCLVKSGQPFDRALTLAEEIAKHAKTTAKGALGATPSLLALHRVTGASFQPYGDVLDAELTVSFEGRALLLTAGPYASDGSAPSDRPPMQALLDLADILDDPAFPGGVMRRIVGELRRAPIEAAHDYRRFREVQTQRGGSSAARRTLIARFDETLGRLGVVDPSVLPRRADGGMPLLDAFSILAARREGGDAQETRDDD